MQSEINVQYGMTIYDVVMATYGSPDYMVKLLEDNDISIDYNFDANPGKKLVYDPDYVKPLPPDILSQPKIVSTIAAIKAVNGQTLWDIAIMTYGTTELMVKLLLDNRIDNLNEEAIDQKSFTFDTELVKDAIYRNSLGTYVINTGGELVADGLQTHYRITSAGEYRITSAGNKRIWT